MTENKIITPKPASRVAKPRHWRHLRREMIINSKLSKLSEKFRKSFAALSSSSKEVDEKVISTKADSKPAIVVEDSKNSWRQQKRSMLINHEVSKFTRTFRESFVTLIASALGVVAALSWNDAIKAAIDTLLPSVGNLVYKFYVAMSVTVISVVITYFVSRIRPKN
jgi:hypothetical protein